MTGSVTAISIRVDTKPNSMPRTASEPEISRVYGLALRTARTLENRNSFHEKAKQLMTTDTSVGVDKGSATSQNAWNCVAPSTNAASCKSGESSAKKSRMISTANGRVKVTLTIVRPSTVSSKCRVLNMSRNGMTVAIGGKKR